MAQSKLTNRILSTSTKGTQTRVPTRLPSIPVPGASQDDRGDKPTVTPIDLNLYQRDLDAIAELSSFVVQTGRQVVRSTIIRAALQVAPRDQAYLAAYDQIVKEDPRRTRRA